MKEIIFAVLEIASGICGLAALCGFVKKRWKLGDGALFVCSMLSGIAGTCINMDISGVNTDDIYLIIAGLTLLVIFGIFAVMRRDF